ncbi:MAG TPA: hypothetical protein VI818_01730 [Candidatus Thermoplasmatota archaeon]|nr:hypothetical protein [Candidatus Thermoplasmatota archaeon]
MVPSPPKKPAGKGAKAAPSKVSAPKKPSGPPVVNPLPLKGKKVVGPKTPTPPSKVVTPEPVVVPPTPAPEPLAGNEKQLCWIELVKNGNVFIARSHTGAGAAKEYKNRVLEDMLTELIVELQEEIQE